jgi:hypothetical protein
VKHRKGHIVYAALFAFHHFHVDAKSLGKIPLQGVLQRRQRYPAKLPAGSVGTRAKKNPSRGGDRLGRL